MRFCYDAVEICGTDYYDSVNPCKLDPMNPRRLELTHKDRDKRACQPTVWVLVGLEDKVRCLDSIRLVFLRSSFRLETISVVLIKFALSEVALLLNCLGRA